MEPHFDPSWIDSLEPVVVYKHDKRSRVWKINSPDGQSFVVKRFEYNPTRQLLALLLLIHPGQRERRASTWLRDAKIQAVPIVATGISYRGLGVQYWLATPYVGESLYNLFYHNDLVVPDERTEVLESAGELTRSLINHMLFNRDHKASNILIDQNRQAWLIDYGGVRHVSQSRADRMLANLRANLTEAGADVADLDRLEKISRLGPQAHPSR